LFFSFSLPAAPSVSFLGSVVSALPGGVSSALEQLYCFVSRSGTFETLDEAPELGIKDVEGFKPLEFRG